MTHLSKMNMLTSLDACDPMPLEGIYWHESMVDPQLKITQRQEREAGDARFKRWEDNWLFESGDHKPKLPRASRRVLGL